MKAPSCPVPSHPLPSPLASSLPRRRVAWGIAPACLLLCATQEVRPLGPYAEATPTALVVVDDDFGPSIPGWAISRFASIQDGVDAVAAGGAVLVQEGLYDERVSIDKPLVLESRPPLAARVQGGAGESVLRIGADGVTIRGFSIASAPSGYSVLLASSHNTVEGNVEPFAGGGIRLEAEANDNAIVENRVARVSGGNDYGTGCHRNRIEGNALGSIGLARSSSNRIAANAIETDSRAITLDFCGDTEIAANEIRAGYEGIGLSGSPRTRIVGNRLGGRPYYAITVDSSDSCTVSGNTMENEAIRYTGVRVLYSSDVRVSDNRYVAPETGTGILLYQSTRAVVTDNVLSRGGIGIDTYWDDRQYWDSHQISGNTLDGRPILYRVDVPDLVVPPDSGQVILVGCDRARVQGLALSASIQLAYCSEVLACDNEISGAGIEERRCDSLTVGDNTFLGAETAIRVSGTNHLLTRNRIEAADRGIALQGATGSVVSDNEFRFAGFGLTLSEGPGVTTPTGNEVSGNAFFGNTVAISVHRGDANVFEENRIEASLEVGVDLGDAATNNTVARSSIVGNTVGLRLAYHATGNAVLENSIVGNGVGVGVADTYTVGNRIHHNDLANLLNAYDAGANAWDDGAGGGNHWDDYGGPDADHDGVGDTPYAIPGGASQDGHPLMGLRGPAALWPEVATLSAGSGGPVAFQLYAGASRAGRPYLLLGSMTGTQPGIALPGGATLPLVRDAFTNLILANLDTPLFTGFLGVLDGEGRSSASWNVGGPPGLGLVGLTLSFAYVLGDPLDVASIPVSVVIVE